MHASPRAFAWVQRWSALVPRRHGARPGLRFGRHLRWFAQLGCSVTGVDRDATALGHCVRLARDGRRRHRERPLAAGGDASTRWWSPTTCGAAAATHRRGVARAACWSTKPSPPATRRSANPPARTSCCAGRTAARLRGLRVVAYEDGFLTDPERFVQRLAARCASRRHPAARHPLGRRARMPPPAKIPGFTRTPHEPIVGSIVALVTLMHEDGASTTTACAG